MKVHIVIETPGSEMDWEFFRRKEQCKFGIVVLEEKVNDCEADIVLLA